LACEEVDPLLLFCDWLRSHPADQELYEYTKRELASQEWNYTQNYVDAKSAVMQEILVRVLSLAKMFNHQTRYRCLIIGGKANIGIVIDIGPNTGYWLAGEVDR